MFIIFSKQRILACKEHFKQQSNLWEQENMGNYRIVFSEKNSHLYEHFFYWNESSTLYRNTIRSLLHPQSSLVFQEKVVYLLIINNFTFYST